MRKKVKDDIHIATQTKLIRSQNRGLWISIFLTFIFSFVSLIISLFTYIDSEKESCSITVDLIEDNYDTRCIVSRASNSSGELIDLYSTIRLKFVANIINTSKNPITLISYDCINPDKSQEISYEFMIRNGTDDSFIEHRFDNAIRLEPGQYFKHEFFHNMQCDVNTHKMIKNRKTSSIFELLSLVYKSKKDIFGNNINCDTLPNGLFNGYSFNSTYSLKQYHFIYVLKTAKRNYLKQIFSWYNNIYPAKLPFFNYLTTYAYQLKYNMPLTKPTIIQSYP